MMPHDMLPPDYFALMLEPGSIGARHRTVHVRAVGAGPAHSMLTSIKDALSTAADRQQPILDAVCTRMEDADPHNDCFLLQACEGR